MQALGFIETRGLVTAVESADAMLKSAEVTLVEKTYVGGGLVSIVVTGDVAAVSAAVEAGAAATKRIKAEWLVSKHIIPRPHEELTSLIRSVKPMVKQDPKTKRVELEKESELGEIKPKKEAKIEGVKPKKESVVQDVEVKESKKRPLESDVEEINKHTIDHFVHEYGLQETLHFLSKLKVTILRKLAREYKKFGIVGRSISKANKTALLTEFKEYYDY